MRLNRILGSRHLFLFIIFLFVFICLLSIKTYHGTNILHDHHYSNEEFHHLINKQKVLVPVSIDQLYDYRVVCSGNDGILDPSDSIKQLRDSCQTILNGSLTIDLNSAENLQLRSLLTLEQVVHVTSTRTIDTCRVFQNESLAIVIAYRNREDNLRKLLYNILPLLKRQRISNYRIFIIEQKTDGPFNKGRLYNIAFNHLMMTYKPTCVIFHDVDLIPENDQNLYSCYSTSDRPIHMSAHVRFQINGSYTTIYSFLVGGVLAIRPKTFKLLNGYSNRYFNWGGEDDDMGLRLLSKNICVRRPSVGYYYAGPHSIQTRNKNRFRLLFDAVLRQDTDGLNNIDHLATITRTQDYPLVTWFTVKWLDRTSHDLSSIS